jgi:hypothetical protein
MILWDALSVANQHSYQLHMRKHCVRKVLMEEELNFGCLQARSEHPDTRLSTSSMLTGHTHNYDFVQDSVDNIALQDRHLARIQRYEVWQNTRSVTVLQRSRCLIEPYRRTKTRIPRFLDYAQKGIPFVLRSRYDCNKYSLVLKHVF